MIYAYQVWATTAILTETGGIDEKTISFSPAATTFYPELALKVSMFNKLVLLSDITPSPTSADK
jgi:hypothetical protein